MKTKNLHYSISGLLAAIGIVTSLSLYIYQNHFNRTTMLLSDENILPIFAGDYFQMKGHGSTKLTLRPDLTFTYFIHTDIDVMYGMIFNGIAIIRNGQIQLLASDKDDGDIFVPKYLVPIRWGNYKYLVEPDHISYFCEGIIAGEEPFPAGYSNHLRQNFGYPLSSVKAPPILPNRKLACP